MIYLDSAASTALLPEVINQINNTMNNFFANPSSLHEAGFSSEQQISDSRKVISAVLKKNPDNTYFTSGATEANNWAIESCWLANKAKGSTIFATEDAHPSIKEKLISMQSKGATVKLCPVDQNGLISLSYLEQNLSKETIFFSILALNNETGIKQDLKKIIPLIKNLTEHCIIHVDAVQSFCKTLDTSSSIDIDLISISAHKIGGPKGVGALLTKKGLNLLPFILGGGQEKHKRAGTENLIGITGFNKAVEIMHRNEKQNYQHIKNLQTLLETTLKNNLDNIIINGYKVDRSPYISSISIKGIKAEVLLHSLAEKKIYISTGAACTSKKNSSSYVLKAMKIDKDFLEGTIRISYFPNLTEQDILIATDNIISIVNNLRKKF